MMLSTEMFNIAGRVAELEVDAERLRSRVDATDWHRMTWDAIERAVLAARLRAHRGNRAAVARSLGLSERTVYRKTLEYGLRQEGYHD